MSLLVAVLAMVPTPKSFDVVVIGSGIGGLSAAAAAASTGLRVAVCESHDAPGGAAHEWTVKGFHFESGPSLYAGLSLDHSPNPLKHAFQVCGEEPEWLTYDRWGKPRSAGHVESLERMHAHPLTTVESLKHMHARPMATVKFLEHMHAHPLTTVV
jgi:phytoene dehydrogenase-like protein